MLGGIRSLSKLKYYAISGMAFMKWPTGIDLALRIICLKWISMIKVFVLNNELCLIFYGRHNAR